MHDQLIYTVALNNSNFNAYNYLKNKCLNTFSICWLTHLEKFV